MTAPTGSAAPSYRSRSAGRVRFTDLLAAEWLKLWSLRSTYWVLGVCAVVVTGINANSARSNADRLAGQPVSPPYPPPGGVDRPFLFDPLTTAFTEPAWQILMAVAGAVGAAVLSGEYATGLVRTTFAAVPDRRSLLAAKTLVVTVALLGSGAVVSGASFGLTQALLRDQGGLSLTDPGALRAVVGSALLAPLCGLIGMATAAVVRHAAGSAVGTAGLLLLLPALFRGDTYRWVAEIGNSMPFSAWEALVHNPERDHGVAKYPVEVAEAWLVYGAWSVAAVIVAVVVTDRRDV
ncbi:ABC transporter permease [Streptomyces uncialis]|uniref:ABC transporter permease n=1 Tax=Streptomyces uncialis TaxID=1048205 RepID=UPI00381B6B96